MSETFNPNAIQYMDAVHEVLAEEQFNYRVVGGIATAAISEIEYVVPKMHSYTVNSDIFISRIRDNGTVRDLDVLVLDTNETRVEDANRILNEKLNGALEISVFGLRRHLKEYAPRGRKNHLTDWTSHRTKVSTGEHMYVSYPFEQQVSADSYDPWQANVEGGLSFLTLSPPAHVQAYRMRSISGLRPRDRQKVEKMESVLDEKFPNYENFRQTELKDWIEFEERMQAASFASALIRATVRPNREEEEGSGYDLGTAFDEAVFVGRRNLMRFLDSQEWAVDIAHGKGILGKSLAPILHKFAGGE